MIKAEMQFVTDFDVVPFEEEPEAARLWNDAPKRKDGDPDKRYKASKQAWAEFKKVSERSRIRYEAGA